MRYARQSEAPVLHAIRGAQGQYDAAQSAREQNAEGFAQALAKMLGGIGPATGAAYDHAAGATAGFGKGFSDAEQHIADTEGATLGSFLDKAGIPQEAAHAALGHVGGTSDVLYGLTGYIPGSNLEREGAAFTAAANQLPAYAAGLGEQNLAQLETARQKQDQTYEQELQAERAKIPSLANQLLQQMITNGRANQSLAIQQQYLGQSSRRNQISATGVDPVTHQAKPGYYKDKSGRVLPDGYVWRNGHPVRQSSSRKGSGGYDYGGALTQASPHINKAASDLITVQKSSDPLAGLPGHPATVTTHPPYAQAARQLFMQFRYLLRQVPAKRRPAAKRQLTAAIRDALYAAGITPPGPSNNVHQPDHPGVNP